jgi:hypothetical protein
MTVQEMLRRIGSSEIADWAAIFSIEDEEAKKAQKNGANTNTYEDEDDDITDQLIEAIEAEKAEA